MRPAVLGTLIALVLVAGAARAQTSSYAAFSVGFPLLGNVHVGFEDVIAPGVDLRLTLGGALLVVDGDGAFYGVLVADVLYRVNHTDPEAVVVPYVGAGPGIGFAGVFGGTGVAFNGSGVAGVALHLGETTAFIEARLNVTVAGGGALAWPHVGVGLAFGL